MNTETNVAQKKIAVPQNLRLTRRNVLKCFGLPWATSRIEAHKVYKQEMVKARKSGDEETQKNLSRLWAFLKRNLKNVCSCGVPVSHNATSCSICVLRVQMVIIAAMLAGCVTSPTTHHVEPVQPLPPLPQVGEPTVARTANIQPKPIVAPAIGASVAPTAAPVPAPFTNVLAMWTFRTNETLMVIHSKTNLYGPWTYRTSTTNTSIKFPANKKQEWFWFWPISRGGSFHYGTGYIMAP